MSIWNYKTQQIYSYPYSTKFIDQTLDTLIQAVESFLSEHEHRVLHSVQYLVDGVFESSPRAIVTYHDDH